MKKPNELNMDTALNQIINFLDQQSSFKYIMADNKIVIQQSEDQKKISINIAEIEKVLSRVDFDGSQFLQVNFQNQLKILITKNLVGFKPVETIGFDSQKIPKVVTTIDLVSIVTAIEDLYDSEDSQQTMIEIEVLKKVFQSILTGAESVGFDMRAEKMWFSRNMLNKSAASA